MVSWSGSKSQPGSGFPFWTPMSRSSSLVDWWKVGSVTLWQYPPPLSPSAALNVSGSQSSNATTCATLGSQGGSATARVTHATATQPASRVTTVILCILDPSCSGGRDDAGDDVPASGTNRGGRRAKSYSCQVIAA